MSYLTSSHFWSIVLIGAIAGLNAVLPQTSGIVSQVIQVLLGAYAVWNHQSVANQVVGGVKGVK